MQFCGIELYWNNDRQNMQNMFYLVLAKLIKTTDFL